jgi:hypothetical protein
MGDPHISHWLTLLTCLVLKQEGEPVGGEEAVKESGYPTRHTGRYRQPGTNKLNTMSAVEPVVVADSWANALATIHLQCPRTDNQQTTRESIIDNCKIEWTYKRCKKTLTQQWTNSVSIRTECWNVATKKMPIVIYDFLFFCEYWTAIAS